MKIRTRFPPEPNGFIHLGHLKSMYFNFNFGKLKELQILGEMNIESFECYLRFDDTNPETEKQDYVDSILGCVDMMEYKPDKITYTSDYFDNLYDYAIQMIKNGFAYVDDLSSDDISKYRRDNIYSPFRDRSIEENLNMFNNMKKGIYEESQKSLRLKVNDSNNSSLQDPIIYRIKYVPHNRTKDKWCIYPTYDFSHCIVDSLEGITHSFCTLEFVVRREQYYWILDKLNLRKPIVYEFNRLDTNFGILSKRKVKELVDNKVVNGWDDPLLLTVEGLLNKGYNREILNIFCSKLGFTTTSDIKIEKSLLDSVTRDYLNEKAYRTFGILDPLEVVITNFDTDKMIERPNHPYDETFGKSNIVLKKIVYINRSDFKVDPEKKYFRLKPDGEVRLKYGGVIKYLNHEEDDGKVIRVNVEYREDLTKLKGVIGWTSNKNRVPINFFDYDKMKKCTTMGIVDDTGFDYYQFERVGFFKKTSNGFNHLCDLRSSY
jgi:glutaminyl-tRNA synthetase